MNALCLNCIGDKSYKAENQFSGFCDFCHKESKNCIRIEDLFEMLEPFLKLYTPVEAFVNLEELKEREFHEYIWDILQEDWELFPEFDSNQLQLLLTEIMKETSEEDLLYSNVKNDYEYYGEGLEKEAELKMEWNKFCDEIINRNRYFPKKIINLPTLKRIIGFLDTRIKTGEVFYRARISEDQQHIPCSKMGIPPARLAKNGRANPIGIPYLYVAKEEKTAVFEIKPKVSDTVVIGEFFVLETLSIINLSVPRISSPFRFRDRLQEFLLYKGYLRLLGNELSKPIDQIKENEYIPLQYLCEFIKSCGYDGVSYHSSICSGENYAFFSDEKLKCRISKSCKISDISFTKKSVTAIV